MKPRIGMKVYLPVCGLNIASSDRLSFPSVEIDKNYSLTPAWWKILCHKWSRDQLLPGSSYQRQREGEPGNEVATASHS